MIQALIKKGKVIPVKVPVPVPDSNLVLIKVDKSCISAGTETKGVTDTKIDPIKAISSEPSKVNKVIALVYLAS